MAAQPRPRLSLLDCVAIGVNGIVGSGIFLLPGRMAAEAGPSSILAFLACGFICLLVALCFAEAAGTFDRSGGAFLYARTAFGETAGFAIGWMSLVEGVVGYAAGARGLATQMGTLVPALGSDLAQAACAGEVYLLHTERRAGQPSVKSRWLWRLETLAKGAGVKLAGRPEVVDWARRLDAPGPASPAPRPAPTPPVADRPRKMAVTRIEALTRALA